MAFADHATISAVLFATGVALVVGQILLILAGVAPIVRSIAVGQRREAVRWARQHNITLVDVAALVSCEREPRAATILIRRLLAHADRVEIAVIARPRDDRLTAVYVRLGFRALPGGRRGLLVRPPQSAPKTQARLHA